MVSINIAENINTCLNPNFRVISVHFQSRLGVTSEKASSLLVSNLRPLKEELLCKLTVISIINSRNGSKLTEQFKSNHMRRLTVIQFQISDQLESNPGAVAPLVLLEMPVECDLPVHPQPNKKTKIFLIKPQRFTCD